MSQENHTRAEAIAGLRAFADFLEAHPDACVPTVVAATEYVPSREAFAKRRRLYGGRWEKDTANEFGLFQLVRRFGPNVRYEMYGSREAVCTRRVVGTRTVEREFPADPEAADKLREQLATLPLRTETVEEDIVEWDCGALLEEQGA